MQKLYKQPLLIIGTIIVLLVGLILAVTLSQRATINRSHAVAATTLAFSPSSSTATVGSPLTMSISLNPGTNEVSSIKFDILYDASVFSAGASPLTIDPSLFPSPAVGGTPIPNHPVITVNGNQGEIQETISVGSNPNAVITSPVIIGTLTLNTNPNTTTTNSQITWGTNTAVYSIGPSDLANENVLASAQSETVTVSGVNLPTSTPTPTVTPVILPTSTPTPTPIPPTNTPKLTPTITPLPSNTPTPTSAPSPTPTITPTAVPTDNIFNMNVFLDGIGQAGDLVNRNGGGNPNLHHTTRTAMIELDDANAMPVSTATGSVNYNAASGNFVNQQFDFGRSVTAGNYLVKVKVLGYLWKRIPGFLSLTPGETVILPATYLVTGDINNDNVIDLLDYNILISCFNALGPAQGTCTAADQTAADLDDDGTVDLIDYNLWLRDHSVVKGD